MNDPVVSKRVAIAEHISTFDDLPLHIALKRGAKEMGYMTPTPIQMAAIPEAVLGHDIIGTSQTGSGKTAAFLLPMLERLTSQPKGHTYALVLTPTRELAIQAEKFLHKLGRYTHVEGTAVYGGVGFGDQVRALRGGSEIIIATPGRLLDHMRRGNVNLRSLKVLVLDEADRMLDMGFIPDVREIMHHVPKERQTMLFTATMPPEIVRLANEFLSRPKHIRVKEATVAATGVSHRAIHVPANQKTEALCRLLSDREMSSVLVFTRTKHRADRLARQLSQSGIRSAVIHGDRSQSQRIRALEAFRNGRERVLVATDIAARGIDVEGVSHVVNYDVPHDPEVYVHRVGRTARASRTGDAVTLVSHEERDDFDRIQQFIGEKIAKAEVPGFVPSTAPPHYRESGPGHRNTGHHSQEHRRLHRSPTARW